MSPEFIGITLSETAPTGLYRQSSRGRHCEFAGKARKGKAFLVVSTSISCPLARYYLGLDPPEGETMEQLIRALMAWKDAKDRETAGRFLESLPVLAYPGKRYILYVPIAPGSEENGTLDVRPDVVVMIGTTEEVLEIVRRNTFLTGERVASTISGIGALCGECTAYPLATGKMNVSVGCEGSRCCMGLKNGEMLLAMPFETYRRLILGRK